MSEKNYEMECMLEFTKLGFEYARKYGPPICYTKIMLTGNKPNRNTICQKPDDCNCNLADYGFICYENGVFKRRFEVADVDYDNEIERDNILTRTFGFQSEIFESNCWIPIFATDDGASAVCAGGVVKVKYPVYPVNHPRHPSQLQCKSRLI